jgi:glycosyltransferase involved in cell wall biosynthesis
MTKQRNLKILYAIESPGIKLEEDYGSTVVIKSHIQGLQENGHQIEVVHTQKPRVVYYTHDLKTLDSSEALFSGISQTRSFLSLESAIRRAQTAFRLPYIGFFESLRFYEAVLSRLDNFDLCHVHGSLLTVGAELACIRQRKPYILTIEADPLFELIVVGTPLKGLSLIAARWKAALSYSRAERIICLSNALKKHLVSQWHIDAGRIVVVPDGINPEEWDRQFDESKVRKECGIETGPTVMFVGSFQPWHGVDLLLESFKFVLNEVPEAKLLLVGDGPTHRYMQNKAEEIKITEATIFMGSFPYREIPRILSMADVVTLPYPRLPRDLWFSPLKLYEYMAAGKAIVASNSGQITEVLQGGDMGLLVEPGDVKELSNAILYLFRNPQRRAELGQNARRQALLNHSWASRVKQIEKVYYEVLG